MSLCWVCTILYASSLRLLEDTERYILSVLKETNWIIDGKPGDVLILGMNSGTIRSRMKKLNIMKKIKDLSAF